MGCTELAVVGALVGMWGEAPEHRCSSWGGGGPGQVGWAGRPVGWAEEQWGAGPTEGQLEEGAHAPEQAQACAQECGWRDWS